MIFTIMSMDRPNAGSMRKEIRPVHKSYLGKISDRIAFAGPLVADDGQTMIGSLLAIDFPDREAVNAWIRDEPFNKAGLYESVQVHAFMNLWPQRIGFPPL